LLDPTVPTLAFSTDDLTTEIRDRARALVDRGVTYARVVAALAVAEARLGNAEAVRYLMDYERFMRLGTIDLPNGMPTDEFNRALAAEIKSNLKYYDHPSDRAIRRAWRFDGFHRADTPALRMLTDVLYRHAAHYTDCLGADSNHPFIASRPKDFAVAGWAVYSDGASYHKPHVHSRAWVTGVYYVVQPDVSRVAGSHRGWLRVGPPPALEQAVIDCWPTRLIEPASGSFIIMPGYFWHDTEPMGIDQERICVAFEVQPLELALGPDGRDD
jgi:hypothetical protein